MLLSCLFHRDPQEGAIMMHPPSFGPLKYTCRDHLWVGASLARTDPAFCAGWCWTQQ
jgi:hypothetical protein